VFISAVGQDALGTLALDELSQRGVDTSLVRRDPQAPTGQAFIMTDPGGENIIVVTSGANFGVSPARVAAELARQGNSETARDSVEAGGRGRGGGGGELILLAQGELKPDYTEELPLLARRLGARLVLNLAPVSTRSPELLAAADLLIVNEVEAADLLGMRPPGAEDLEPLLLALQQRRWRAVVTLGARGAAIVDGEHITHVPAVKVPTVVDTTGAGDAFAGTLAAALAEGSDLPTATRFAVAAGSLATQRPGAASSYASGAVVRSTAHSSGRVERRR
ncbi:ribokinase, partial [Corynebacterium heidelbergense]